MKYKSRKWLSAEKRKQIDQYYRDQFAIDAVFFICIITLILVYL